MSESDPPVRILFETLTGLERPEEREAFLNFVCRDDPGLRARLDRLLSLRAGARDFFDIETAPSPPHDPGGDPSDDATEGVGTRIGRYRLIERLGEGGCGVVYLAEQLEPVRRRVALKIIRLGMDTENVIARFEMERQALAMMDHPNIARVFDVGATRAGRPFFVMQLVDGRKITDYCDAERLGIPQRLKLFNRICQAIQHAHQKGVIHRDIKPSNIIIWEHDGEAVPKVIDFGIAKATEGRNHDDGTLTAAGQFVGTPAYTSPEQAAGRGMDVDTRSDIFSLGALLYELLTGQPPVDPAVLREAGVEEARRMLQEEETEEPSAAVARQDPETRARNAANRNCEPSRLAATLRGDLDRIVMMAMAKDRSLRYGTADALAADVSRYLNNEPIVARPPSGMYRMRKLVRRNRLAVGAGGIVFLSLVLGLGGATWMYVRSNRARHAAELARANEAKLRVRAEIAGDVARAAVLLKRGAPQDADKLLERIPPALAQPSLESAETFEVLALWHARQGRWRQAGDRFSALVHSLTSVDESDAETISIYLLPAAASLCEAGDLAGYDALRTLAIKRFGGTRNPVVAEQVVKACLIRPADRDLLARLKPLERLMLTFDAEARVAEPHDRNLAGWRAFSIALIEYRGGNPDAALNAIEYCMKYSGENPARDALVDTLAAMIWHRKGRREEVLPHLEAARKSIETRFAATPDIFREHEPKWQDWINARILLREAAGQIGD